MRIDKGKNLNGSELCDKGRILIVDNERAILDELKYRLEREGYEVFVAESPDKAKELLQRERVHLAVIDLRLIDHTNNNDISGIILAEEIDSIIEKIILTAFPSIETMQKALGPHLNGKALTFHYIDKPQGPRILLETIKKAFSNKVQINFDLKIHSREKDFEDLLDEVFVRGEKIIDKIGKEKVCEELAEVFKKLFYSTDEIIISPIYSKGYSGTGVVLVTPSRSGRGIDAPVIVKFGGRNEIKIETRNYKNHVAPYLQFRCTTTKEAVYTQNLGGIMYTLVGTSLKDICDFREYYEREDKVTINKTLEHLFREICELWYRNRGNIQEQNLSDIYRKQLGLFPYKKLEKALKENFPEHKGKSTITFPGLDGSFINPIVWLKNKTFPFFIYLCCTHGDLNGKNILVDEDGHPWLIDFFRTGYGHILRDFVELEADIKFNYLETSNIEALYEFEKSLVSPKQFDEPYAFENKNNINELDKAFAVIKNLRELAHSVVEPGNDIREYYIGLLYHTINIIRYPNIRKERLRHAFLSSSLICERLEKW